MTVKKWDMRFLEMAKLVSSWSKDPGTQVGAIIVDDKNRVISVGFNGFPRGVKDYAKRLKDRDLKLSMTIHAEENAIFFAKGNLENCTVYVYPFLPCSSCASKIIQKGVNRVVSVNNFPDKWKESFELSMDLFKEANVQVKLYEDLNV